MAGHLNRRNAQDVLNAHKGQIDLMLSKLKEEDPDLYKIFVDAGDLARISQLGDFYKIVPSAEPTKRGSQMNKQLYETRTLERSQAMNPAYDKDVNVIEVNGEEYAIEDYLRNPELIDKDTPAAVLRRKQKLYPEGINLEKIPQAQSKTEASLFALGMNALTEREVTRNTIRPEPVRDLSVASRAMDPNLAEALDRQMLLNARSPLHTLKTAGMHGDSKGRTAAGTADDIQSVMIGDMIRGFNPVTGVPYGPAFIENGALVRDQLQGGHVRESNKYEDLRHQPDNIVAELSQENTAKASRGKEGSPDFTDEQALFNTAAEALNNNQSLDNFKQSMRTVAQEQPALAGKISILLTKLHKIEQMKPSTRRTKKNQSNWSNLLP